MADTPYRTALVYRDQDGTLFVVYRYSAHATMGPLYIVAQQGKRQLTMGRIILKGLLRRAQFLGRVRLNGNDWTAPFDRRGDPIEEALHYAGISRASAVAGVFACAPTDIALGSIALVDDITRGPHARMTSFSVGSTGPARLLQRTVARHIIPAYREQLEQALLAFEGGRYAE